MNGNHIGIVVCILCGILMVVIWGGVLLRRLSPIKTVQAEIIEKHTYAQRQVFANQAPQLKQMFLISFATKEGKLSFFVSPDSYDCYTLHRKGKLKYKGNQLIKFRAIR